MRSKLKKVAAIGLGTLAVPVGVAVAAAAPASAGPEICATGPYGYVSACVEGPGWGRWHNGPRWHGRGHGHGHGGWDD
ncbi:hypothetical protein BA059_26650 [Mycolicibacterium sp. (ex Dasyatis americana)]|uniref:hypothetical protein n=1 Tax=Mycobacterium sp. DBP42 TaxID=2545267 RepID=UPI00087251BB|nr:hypothetical protein [Mycobacterium sp. DBP42]OFB35974.1 hypothetical protein BA059_26650 [Mycolicibacterium sp. (ex Dasyatis americana)]TMS52700.1 hypothetical protein E0T84_14540 [Mycobacterium sp. DBP42]